MSRYQNSSWTMGREIAVTWLIAAAVVGVLLLLPAHDGSSLDQALSTLSPAASVDNPAASEDPEGTEPPASSTCLERDYANERC
ncbi:MAG TPA: hypothetical protein VMC10_10795 [Stellaceae bacterium]|nr:hypothetical protein [Stellaceae bacterium]